MTLSDDELVKLEKSSDPKDTLGILLMEHISDVVDEAIDAAWTRNEEIIIDRFDRDDDSIIAVCSISFDELSESGCEDMPYPDDRYVRLKVEVGLETGEVTFPDHEESYVG